MNIAETIESNEIIGDFLDWNKRIDNDEQCMIYKVPNNFKEDTGWFEMEAGAFMFDTDWNWYMYLWQIYLRKIAVPIIRDNPSLRYLRTDIQKTKKAIVWGHIDTAYELIVKLIKTYNNLFE